MDSTRLCCFFGPLVATLGLVTPAGIAQAQSEPAPTFERDPSWPKPLPNNWGIGIVWGVDVGPGDHVWVLNAADGHRAD